jgi:hypothetical protein
VINDVTYNLALYFVTSDEALKSVCNPFLRKVVKPEAGVISSTRMRNDILPFVMDKLISEMNKKLNRGVSVSLICDIWSNKMNTAFLGVAASVLYADFSRESIILGIRQVLGSHTVENVKITLENLVNEFEFNKDTINFIVVDGGSNMAAMVQQFTLNDLTDDKSDDEDNEDMQEEDFDDDHLIDDSNIGNIHLFSQFTRLIYFIY